MIAIIEFLIYGHVKKWKLLEKRVVRDFSTGERWVRYWCQCEKCGTIRKFE